MHNVAVIGPIQHLGIHPARLTHSLDSVNPSSTFLLSSARFAATMAQHMVASAQKKKMAKNVFRHFYYQAPQLYHKYMVDYPLTYVADTASKNCIP
eukprot:138774-Amphidinium_carterae.2